jgi:hypothetical protein
MSTGSNHYRKSSEIETVTALFSFTVTIANYKSLLLDKLACSVFLPLTSQIALLT